MDNFLSIWLVPQKTDEENLSKIISNLGHKYEAPVFIPHLALFGNVTINFDELKSVVDEIFKNTKPFVIRKIKLNQSEAFFKTVFIEFELNENLKNMFEKITDKTDKRNINTFKPHISLIYKILPEEEKLKIIERAKVKDELIIDKIYIIAPQKGDKDFYDVKNWRILYKKDLI